MKHPKEILESVRDDFEGEKVDNAKTYVSGWASDADYPILNANAAAASALYIERLREVDAIDNPRKVNDSNNVDQKQLANYFDISPPTIRLNYRELYDYNIERGVIDE